MCVCVTGLRDVQYDQIMRWWSSNLVQVLLQPQTPSLFLCSIFTPPSLLLYSGNALTPILPSAPAPALHHTAPPHSTPHCPPLPLGSSVHLYVAWVPIFEVSSRRVLGVSLGVPFIYHSRVSLSTQCITPRSPGPPRSNPEPSAPNNPSLPPPSRRTFL